MRADSVDPVGEEEPVRADTVDPVGSGRRLLQDVKYNSVKSGANWVAIPGCRYNPEDNSELGLFNQHEMTAIFDNVKNPLSQADTSNFTISVFKGWDNDTNEGF